MTKKISQNLDNAWYLDFCASRHICNNKHFFSDFRPTSYEFVTAGEEIIRSEKVGSVHLFTHSRTIITRNNVAYTPRCDSNIISLCQLRESGITYHDHHEQMILKQKGNTIRSASRYKNFFILDTKASEKTMIIQEKDRLMYIQSQIAQIKICHRMDALYTQTMLE